MREALLFFYLKTGGGHFAPVRAVADYLRTTYPDGVEPVLIDGMAKAGGFARFVIEDGYRITQARAQWIYELAYAVTKFSPLTLANSALVATLLRGGIEEAILRHQPRGIVISHFFLIAPILDILRTRELAIPVITIVTDPYTAHPLWFLDKRQTMVVFSERLKESAVHRGIPADRVHVFPFILNPRFSRNDAGPGNDASKAALGFRPDQRVILILGGGDGMPRGFRIAKQLLSRLPGVGVILVCGRNKSLFRRAASLGAAEEGKDLRVFAYVDNVPDLIRLSDAVLTKGGASTVMEIIALGKTPVITTYIWEQEKGNVEFVVKDHRGVYDKRIRMLPEILSGIFDDTPPFRLIRERNRSSPIQSGTPAVAEFIMEYTGLQQSHRKES
jgi:processive 1,2-diacylglycerol beta-glucosyltransferase/1,2-diacylglycerol 3-beta-galactosyltransferase